MSNMDIHDPGIHLPAVIARHEETVQARFWPKFRRSLAAVPFAPDLLAAWYCAMDPQTPARVRAILLGALAYFVTPVDMIPDFIAGLGFTDDLTVLLAAIAVVRGNISQAHTDSAERLLSHLRNGEA